MKMSRYVIHALFVFGLWLGLGLQAHGQTRTVHYYYTDPQGTPLVKTDAQGNVIARYDYTPYGNVVTSLGSPPNGPGYTGHVNDPETGLVYMQARYYQPSVHFLSPDPLGSEAGDIYSFNRYAYANNNPIANVDPDGWKSTDDPCMGNMACESNEGGGDPYAGHFYVQDRIADDIQKGQAQDQQAIAATAPYVQGTASLVPGVSFVQCAVGGCSGADWVLATMAAIPVEGELATVVKALEKTVDAAKGVRVTDEAIQAALKGSNLNTVQGAISKPVVESYVRRLEAGEVAPAIKVDGNVIVDGNHRYVAGRLVGREPTQTAGALSPSQESKVQPIQDLKIDPSDWGNR